MLASAVLLLSVFALALMVSVAQLAALVPEYADQIKDGVANAGNTLRDAGVKQEQIDAVANALDPGPAHRRGHVGALRHPRACSPTCSS